MCNDDARMMCVCVCTYVRLRLCWEPVVLWHRQNRNVGHTYKKEGLKIWLGARHQIFTNLWSPWPLKRDFFPLRNSSKVVVVLAVAAASCTYVCVYVCMVVVYMALCTVVVRLNVALPKSQMGTKELFNFFIHSHRSGFGTIFAPRVYRKFVQMA